jgi:hypothetical protein
MLCRPRLLHCYHSRASYAHASFIMFIFVTAAWGVNLYPQHTVILPIKLAFLVQNLLLHFFPLELAMSTLYEKLEIIMSPHLPNVFTIAILTTSREIFVVSFLANTALNSQPTFLFPQFNNVVYDRWDFFRF